MIKQIIVFTILGAVLGVPRSVLAQHDHGGSQPDAGTPSRASDPGIEQIEQIHKLTARLAVLNETLQSSEDPRELRQGIEEQGRIIAELKSLVTEHHSLMVEQQENPKPERSKKKGCGHHSSSMHH
jgi:hypothetical protein